MSETAPAPTPASSSPGGGEVVATAQVKRLAAQHGVDLSTLAGTGVAGRIRPADVLAAAGVPEAPPAPPAGQVTPLARAWSTAGAKLYPVSPVAAELRARNQVLASRAALSGTPAPTLFSTGDLPPFCASGIDPQALLQVPWQARPAVASAATHAEAYQLVQAYSGPDAEDRAAWDFREVEEGFRARYTAWIEDAMTTDEIADSIYANHPRRLSVNGW